MTLEEFSDEFDTLVDSYRRFKSFDDKEILDSLEFNEYEKSVFLTQAQEKLITSLYTGKNIDRESFEKTEELRRYLSNLVKTETITVTEDLDSHISENSTFFKLPLDLWYIVYESIKIGSENQCLDNKSISILPVTLDDYYKVQQNPFKLANLRRALRLDINNGTVEIVSKYNIKSYFLRYLKRPKPIILTTLTAESINGVKDKSECELHSAIHKTILEEAVKLALQSKLSVTGNNNN